MKQIQAISIFLIICFISSCCPTTSKFPLSNPADPQYDKRLEGTWIALSDEGDAEGYVHVGRTPENLTKVISVETKSNGELDTLIFSMFPTKTTSGSYLNIKAKDLFEDSEGYLIAKYVVSGTNTLAIYYMDSNEVEKAIRSGKLRGEVTYTPLKASEKNTADDTMETPRKIECIKITDNSENIIKFLEESDSQILFQDGFKLERHNLKQKQ